MSRRGGSIAKQYGLLPIPAYNLSQDLKLPSAHAVEQDPTEASQWPGKELHVTGKSLRTKYMCHEYCGTSYPADPSL